YLVLESEILPTEAVVELQDAPSIRPPDDRLRMVRLQRQPLLQVDRAESIEVIQSDYGPYIVRITLAADAPDLEDLTEANVGRRMAFVSEGRVRVSPLINEVIRGRTFTIDGAYDRAEAEAIAEALRAQR
ncbi:MAG: hypothetical protein ABL889_21045, partial [Terricaulis sp.]